EPGPRGWAEHNQAHPGRARSRSCADARTALLVGDVHSGAPERDRRGRLLHGRGDGPLGTGADVRLLRHRSREPQGRGGGHLWPAPGPWMDQMARNLLDAVNGFLRGKRYLIVDRDPLYTREFRDALTR